MHYLQQQSQTSEVTTETTVIEQSHKSHKFPTFGCYARLMSCQFSKKNARKVYSKIKNIDCPAFPNEPVMFSSHGFSHLFYSGRNKAVARLDKESTSRIKLLPLAIKLLKLMPLPQETSEVFIQKTMHKFWAFEEVLEGRRVKVIVRQVGKGKKHFWSVIPAWRKTKFGRKNSVSDLSKQ